ncbi:MAG: hypothetical protein AVDCRST_MAG67-1685 [uncultured Solirubrobacteraceae bacterium]|uniref:Uncharacterized protein n=1 Tax=uncultured Solirubrobacteraceae bacterium TaxID=1162706 RepID=A0A6J4SMZ4_9ACTN|nr:MAG: hypothetical protein AVDCRST_MAG67-1685 [uncultured Solirubrobacteraceae bacterium]
MRPPLAGKRAAARRLGAQVRRRLEPVQRVLPVRRPGVEAPEQQPPPSGAPGQVAAVAGAQPQEPTPDDAAARIDAARERLRASIAPPDEPEA